MHKGKGKGKGKGNAYEREISKKLSLWLSNNKHDDLFWRSHNSGGRYTVRHCKNKRTEGQNGDITSTCSGISEDFLKLFSLELKHYKNINLWGLITNSKTGIISFWRQAEKQANSCSKIPLLIIRENNKPDLVISTEKFYNIVYLILRIEPTMITNLSEFETLFIWKLDQILNIDFKSIKEIIKKEVK